VQDTVIFYLLPYLIAGGLTSRKRKRKSTTNENSDATVNSNNVVNPTAEVEAQQESGSKKRKPRVAFQERRDTFILQLENVLDLEEIVNATNQRRGSSSLQHN
ncbi:GSCOCG00010040001-RA-CDS, partial [Cotesia congregata]